MDEDQQLPYITEDVVAIILLRLPVKSLFRSKCISKWCNSIISDPAFGLKYLQRAYSSPESSSSSGLVLSLLFPFTKRYVEDLSNKFKDVTHTINRRRRDAVLNTSISRLAVPSTKSNMIVASSNGLVLTLVDVRHSCVGAFVLNVCNPLTKKYVPLPKSTISNCDELVFGIATKKCALLTYKVVAIRHVYQDYASTVVEIFSSDTGRWVALEVRCCPGEVLDSSIPWAGLNYNGVLHWFSRKTRTVITYDPYNSPLRFGHIQLPHQRGSCLNGSLIYSGDDEMLKYCEIDNAEGADRVLVWRWEVKSDGNGEWCKEGRFEVPLLHHHCLKLMVALYPWNRQIICHPYIRNRKLTIINPLAGRRGFINVFDRTPQPFPFGRMRWSYHYPLILIQLCPWSSPFYADYSGATIL